MIRAAIGPTTIRSIRALAAGAVFGMTLVMGGCSDSPIDPNDSRSTVQASLAYFEWRTPYAN
jgi:hypothetical protein